MGMKRLGTVTSMLKSSRTLPPSGSFFSRLIGPRRSLRVPRKELGAAGEKTLGDRHVAETEAVLDGKGKCAFAQDGIVFLVIPEEFQKRVILFENRQAQFHLGVEEMAAMRIEWVVAVLIDER